MAEFFKGLLGFCRNIRKNGKRRPLSSQYIPKKDMELTNRHLIEIE